MLDSYPVFDGKKIRLAEAMDLADVIDCEDLAFNLGSRTLLPKNVSPHGELALQIKRGEIHMIAFRARFLGYISFARKYDHLFIAALAVLPNSHRTGVGSRLLAHAEQAASRLGLGTVHLFTDGKNTGNLKFYKRRGYSETGRCKEGEFSRVYFSKTIGVVEPIALELSAA